MDQASINQIVFIVSFGFTFLYLCFKLQKYEIKRESKRHKKEQCTKNFIKKIENFKF